MWLLNNRTPFAAERTWVRDENGAEIWIVAVKASFTIGTDGKQALDAEPSEVSRVPKFRGAPDSTSLLFECDLIHKKTRTDVLIEGDAFAPGGEPTTQVDVSLRVGNIHKVLRVYGDRRIDRGMFGLLLSDPEPFVRMPVRFERSFGGTDRKHSDPIKHGWEPHNPVGTGFGTETAHVIGASAPNIEYPDTPYRSSAYGKPASFGAIARHWAPRLQFAGTYDETWEQTKNPLLPSDFNDLFYQCAPVDQQCDGFLKGGEMVELRNMTPDGCLSFLLPRVTLALNTRFYDGSEALHTAVLHTVMIRPEEKIPDGVAFTAPLSL